MCMHHNRVSQRKRLHQSRKTAENLVADYIFNMEGGIEPFEQPRALNMSIAIWISGLSFGVSSSTYNSRASPAPTVMSPQDDICANCWSMGPTVWSLFSTKLVTLPIHQVRFVFLTILTGMCSHYSHPSLNMTLDLQIMLDKRPVLSLRTGEDDTTSAASSFLQHDQSGLNFWLLKREHKNRGWSLSYSHAKHLSCCNRMSVQSSASQIAMKGACKRFIHQRSLMGKKSSSYMRGQVWYCNGARWSNMRIETDSSRSKSCTWSP